MPIDSLNDVAPVQGHVEPAPGDIEIQSLVLINYNQTEAHDIRYLTMEFNLYESLSLDHLRGDIVIIDSLGLVSQMPIIGEEILMMSFNTPSVNPDSYIYKPIEVIFRVVGLEKLQTDNIRAEVYKLLLVTPERLMDLKLIVQDFLEGPINQMVKSVAKTYLGLNEVSANTKGGIYTTATLGNHHFVIPSMSPFETIHFLASEAMSPTYTGSNYLFYQDHISHNFVTSEQLLSSGMAEKYYVVEHSLSQFPAETTSGQTATNEKLQTLKELRVKLFEEDINFSLVENKNPAEWRTMFNLVFETNFNVEKNLTQGLYDNMTLWIDPIMQQFEFTQIDGRNNLDYLKDFAKFKHTEANNAGFPLISDFEQNILANGSGMSSIRYIVSNKNQTDPRFQVAPRARQDFLPFLSSLMGQMDSVVCTITVPGNSDRVPGENIFFDLHEIGATDDIIFELNQYISGKYLITSVRHKYTYGSGYTTIMQCVKNCYKTKIHNEQPPRTEGSPPAPNAADTIRDQNGNIIEQTS